MSISRSLASLHRWIGIALCLFFAMWFLSGMVLMYVPFPSLSMPERLDRSPAVDPLALNVSPAEALRAANLDDISRFRLLSRGDRPIYVIDGQDGERVAVSAATGEILEPIDRNLARRIGEQFSGKDMQSVAGPVEYDQWIVSNEYDLYRPFYRLHVHDPAGTTLYISQLSGEVVQRTRRTERSWNYIGAIIHWIYPTFLRRHWEIWDQFVWWLSLVGIVGVVAGVWLGIVRMRAALRLRNRGLSPYRNWMRWHHVLGIFIGVFVFTWIVSGWLSMDHGRLFSEPYPSRELVSRFRGVPLSEAVQRIPMEHIRRAEPFREGEITAVGGIPVWITRLPETQRVEPLKFKAPSGMVELPRPLLAEAMDKAILDANIVSSAKLEPRDTYTNLRAGSLPASTVRFVLDDPNETWVHVDAASGEVLSVMDRSRRIYRWIFNGLHSLDFPALVNRRPLWDLTMLIFLSAGFAFSITAVVIGTRRVRTTFRNRRRV